ncbi:MAG: hypothetical protein C0508_24300 [Cyanobacteria bacterium PR.023]|nr:hypothetical protein [Cyanobacteria bacterium PR.023]
MATAQSLCIHPVELSFELIGKQGDSAHSSHDVQLLLSGLPTIEEIYDALPHDEKSRIFRELYNKGKFFKASYKTTSLDQDLLIELGRLAVRLQRQNIVDFLGTNVKMCGSGA